MKSDNKSILDQLLDEITPIEQAKTDAKMMLAARIADAMQAKGWKSKDLLQAIGKETPSVITKWLSGTHNFTAETLVELGIALDINFLNLEERKNKVRNIKRLQFDVSQKVDLKPKNYFTPILSHAGGTISSKRRWNAKSKSNFMLI